MATLRKIITDAYRESGIIQKGTVPDADQMQEGLDKLLMIIENVYGEEVGGQFQDINYGDGGVNNSFSVASNREVFVSNTYARPSYRLIVNADKPMEVFLDPVPYDGARFSVIDAIGNFVTNPLTVRAETRNIEGDKFVVLDQNNINASWLYRGDLGQWARVSPLTLDSDVPFPSQFDDYFIIKLATRLHPRYLVQTAQETMMHYNELKKKFMARYTTKEEVYPELGLYRLSGSRYHDYTNEDNTIRFNRGIVY